ncbi:hypothetical protein CkaCkLH20_05181 [Colletotrichum karsti]|uniref:Rhodopsin domain-containing protein n=1 Tax=Colletotrichum karsti TaxID=1095194 RepID=A0A9P6I973_9PEZI|nr:uncharacterized protein CkaCkLH20_05181 [Colletotrichum karsti]KAF9877481.1 hypothetical protein CkaCkLH20_05181 [Colletotrichum karsti]
MRLPPLNVTSAWPQPNYTNPEHRGPGLLIVELLTLSIALTCLGLRMYVRLVKIRLTWWDDWMMVGAAVFCIGVTMCVILATELYGWSIHIWDVPSRKITQSRQVSIAAQTLFLFASGLSKLSILASYLRIAVPGTWFSRLTWVTGVIVFILMWTFLAILWTQCGPIWHYWTLFANWEGNCIQEWPPLAGHGITTVMTDIAVYLLPIPTLFKLQMPLMQRISLVVLVGIGLLVVAAGILRTYWVLYVEINIVKDPTYDLTWDSYNIWIWTALEVNLAIICGCAPAIRRFFTKTGNQTPFKVSNSVHTIGSSGIKRWSRTKRPMRRENVEDHGLGSFESLESNDTSEIELVQSQEEAEKS